MRPLLESLVACADAGNWYAALCVALTLPDICARIELPNEIISHRRYADWFDTYIRRSYTRAVGPECHERTFLTGNDCYALRCAFLHEGSDDITKQKAREVVERFHFVVPPPGWEIHCNMVGAKLQLQVDIFCRDIERGVRKWLESALEDERKSREIETGLAIQFPNPGGGMRI